MATVRHFGFLKIRIFNYGYGSEGQCASLCKIVSTGRDIAAVRHRGFIWRMLWPPTKSIWWSLSLYKITLISMQ